MIADIAPHPCGGGAKVFPRNCRLRVFFCWKIVGLWGKGKNFFHGKKPNVGTEVSLPPYPQPLLKKAKYFAAPLSRHTLKNYLSPVGLKPDDWRKTPGTQFPNHAVSNRRMYRAARSPSNQGGGEGVYDCTRLSRCTPI